MLIKVVFILMVLNQSILVLLRVLYNKSAVVVFRNEKTFDGEWF